jgi:phosphate transport system substrate-binding protein
VQQFGIQVVYTAAGSAQGRYDFTTRTTDFGVTDLPYKATGAVGEPDSPCTDPTVPATCRDFGYAPLVAGAVTFPYQLRAHGNLIRNLRLSGATLARIFTGQVTDWHDPTIVAENPGIRLPRIPIIPVVHNEGSATSLQFSSFLSATQPAIWSAGASAYFPTSPNAVGQNGSDGVMNYIASSWGNGAIGYNEFSYALAKNYPVASVLNAAGYYQPPTADNVAIALEQATTNSDGSADLTGVFTAADPRAYPISTYSYALIPTSSTDTTMTSAKRQTLADFVAYAVCNGQYEVAQLGAAPLPLNLVQQALDQVGRLHVADSSVDTSAYTVANCNNPTMRKGSSILDATAPVPRQCDRATSSAVCGGPPGPARSVTARKSAARAVISWRRPNSNGGEPITNYTVTALPGHRHCFTAGRHTCSIDGLRRGVSFTFAVRATNVNGTGPASDRSNPIRFR